MTNKDRYIEILHSCKSTTNTEKDDNVFIIQKIEKTCEHDPKTIANVQSKLANTTNSKTGSTHPNDRSKSVSEQPASSKLSEKDSVNRKGVFLKTWAHLVKKYMNQKGTLIKATNHPETLPNEKRNSAQRVREFSRKLSVSIPNCFNKMICIFLLYSLHDELIFFID